LISCVTDGITNIRGLGNACFSINVSVFRDLLIGHQGLFLLEHGIFAITLGIGRCDKAGVFFIDQNFQKLKVSLLHVIAQISSELLGRSFLNELSFLPSQFYLV
jgi:hypothetical protein